MAEEKSPDIILEDLHKLIVNERLVRTPQQFGAKADGVTDDTDAIQQAVDSGDYIMIPAGNYLMNGTVTINNKKNFCLDARATKITYKGNSYPFELIRCVNCEFHFGSIDSRDSDY